MKYCLDCGKEMHTSMSGSGCGGTGEEKKCAWCGVRWIRTSTEYGLAEEVWEKRSASSRF